VGCSPIRNEELPSGVPRRCRTDRSAVREESTTLELIRPAVDASVRASVFEESLARERKEIQMSRIVVLNHVTLDGVMQGPGRPDEDTRDGFEHGGWSMADNDDVMGQFMGARMAQSGGLLFGQRTCEDLLTHWNSVADDLSAERSPSGMDASAVAAALNNAPKYIASSTLQEPLPWPNSTLLSGDVPKAVVELREQQGNELQITGSGVLIQSLMPHGLIDEYVLLIHPLVFGLGPPAVPRRQPCHPSQARRQRDHDDGSRDRDLPAGRGRLGLHGTKPTPAEEPHEYVKRRSCR
jgi:dihydrofolate reductase